MTRRLLPFELPSGVTPAEAFEVARFLVQYVERLKVSGRTPSAGLSELLRATSTAAIERQSQPVSASQRAPQQALLMSYDEAAELLDCSVRTVNRRVADGVFTPVGAGRGAKLRRSDIQQFVTCEEGARR